MSTANPMTTKETFISEREKEFEEKFGYDDGWNPSSVGTELEKKILAFHHETISQLLERVREIIPLYTAGSLDDGETEESRRGRNEVLKEIRDGLESLLTIEK